jgi:hypothetical protein
MFAMVANVTRRGSEWEKSDKRSSGGKSVSEQSNVYLLGSDDGRRRELLALPHDPPTPHPSHRKLYCELTSGSATRVPPVPNHDSISHSKHEYKTMQVRPRAENGDRAR